MSLDPERRRLDDEMAHHLAELEEMLLEQGMDPARARAEAERRLGDPEGIARSVAAGSRSGRRPRWDSLLQDLGHALRQMVRHPLSSGLTVATVAVGVAAATVVFSVVHAVVLAPLPFEEPDRLVHVSQTSPQGRLYSTSEPNFVDFRERQRSFVEMAAMSFESPVLSGLGDPVSVDGRRVSHTFFSLLGIDPILGRDFLPSEDRAGGPSDVVILSESAWQRRFGGDEEVLGRTLLLDGRAHEVVGVVPSGRAWPGVEVFTPLAPEPDLYRDDQRLEALARLAQGVTLEAARQDMEGVAADLSEAYPESNDGWGAAVRPIRDWLVGERLTRLGAILLGAVALFLLMACASVSNLLVARASARTGEMGIRTALGAGRSRLVGQLLAEGAVLAATGGAVALLLSRQGIALVKAFGPDDIARLGEATLDGGMLLVAMGASVVTVAVAGLAPALLLVRRRSAGLLVAGGRSGTTGGQGLRNALVVAQFALAVTVISGAGLLGRSFMELQRVELGFDPASAVRFTVRLDDARFDQRARADYMERLAMEIGTLPGVEAVGATTAPPFSPMRPSNFVAPSDREPDRQEDFQPVSWRAVTPGYFEATGIPVLQGRVFRPDDYGEPGEPPASAVVVDRALADLLFPGESPVGRRVTWFLPGGQQLEIVGVVASTRDERVDVEARPRIYRPFTFSAWEQPAVIVRTTADPGTLIPSLRAATLRVDSSVPAIAPRVISEDVRRTVAWPRFSMQVLTLFGLVALVLAAMGIYGVTAFSITRRRHEMGVRIALGADPEGVRRMVARRTLRLAGMGIVVGLAAALVLGEALEAILYGVPVADPLTFALVPLLAGLVALVSTWIPAHRAVSLDPRSALMAE